MTTSLVPGSLVRIKTILSVLPMSRSTWWNGVRDGRYPAPIKLGPKITAWRADDVNAVLKRSTSRGSASVDLEQQP